MAYTGIFYLIGLFFASFFSFETSVLIGFGVLFIAILYFFLMKAKKNYVLLCGIALSVGLIIYGGYGVFMCRPVLATVGQEGAFSGTITDWERYANDKSAYTLKGKINGKIPAKVRIYADSFQCNYGDTVQFRGRFSELEDTYVFPEKSYYNSKNIFIKAEEISDFHITERKHFSLVGEIIRYREYIEERISFALPGQEGALLTAMLCGDKDRLSSDNETLLYRIGIGHMMAVSGVHFTILVILFSQLTNGIFHSAKVKFAVTEGIILCFAVFAGVSPSVVRAGILLTLLHLAPVFYHKTDFLNSLGLAAVLLTITSPFTIRDPSFLLSFTGAWAFGYAGPAVVSYFKIKKPLLKAVTYATVASVVITPVSAMFFDEISIISPLSNLLLLPVCTVALVCGILVGITGGTALFAYPLLAVGGFCCKIILAFAELFGKLQFTYFSSGYEFLYYGIIIAAVLVILAGLRFKNIGYTCLMSVCMILTLVSGGVFYKLVNRGTLEIAEFSSATVVSKNNTAVLVLRTDDDYDEIKKYLQQRGISDIETVAFVHGKAAETAAFANDFKLFSVNQIFKNIENYEKSTLEYDGYRIDFYKDNISVTYGDFKISSEKIHENFLVAGRKNGKMKAREITYGSRQG